jgi:hypothetical protein
MLCNKCKYERNEDRFEFRKDRGTFRKVCKDCKNKNVRKKYTEISRNLSERRKEIRENRREELNEKARQRYWDNRDDLLAKAKNRSGYGKSNPETISKWRINNKYKCAAHQAVVRALKSGKIIRPEKCQVCGSKEKLNAHHHDYNKSLDVIWLCVPCHKKVHSKHFNKGGK